MEELHPRRQHHRDVLTSEGLPALDLQDVIFEFGGLLQAHPRRDQPPGPAEVVELVLVVLVEARVVVAAGLKMDHLVMPSQ